jgi:hypothetical protein
VEALDEEAKTRDRGATATVLIRCVRERLGSRNTEKLSLTKEMQRDVDREPKELVK